MGGAMMKAIWVVAMVLPLFGCTTHDNNEDDYSRAAIADTQRDVECRREGHNDPSQNDYHQCMQNLVARDER
jgi:hypothetical protein